MFYFSTQNLRNRIRNGLNLNNDDQLSDQLVNQRNEIEGDRATGSGYTELMGGSVPCPSCNGSGMIPKGMSFFNVFIRYLELEGTLVALIPLNDDRLKPKKM